MKFQVRNNHLINWSEYPILRFTICFIGGIYFGDLMHFELQSCIAIIFLLLGLFFVLHSFSLSSNRSIILTSTLVLCLGFSFGVFRHCLQLDANNTIHFSNQLNEENELEVRMVSEFKKNSRWSATVEVLRINGIKSNGKLLVYFHPDEKELDYQYGDLYTVQGWIQALKDNTNPHAFNYKDYLKYKGVGFQVFLKKGKHQLISKGSLNEVKGRAISMRNNALAILERNLSNKEHLAIASAMVLGYREGISDQLYTTFSETGAVHILAVSGLHVGIICMIFLFVFNRIQNESILFKVFKLLVLLLVVWSYAMITGASPAVLRASVMFSLLLIGKLWFRGANIYNILAFSALLILLYDPFLLFQLSFQFSYLALISIVFFQPKIERLYETKNPVATKIWQLTTVAIAAQILVFPISIYYFHTFPTYFILSGVAAVFLASFILALGLILIFTELIFGSAVFIAECYSVLLKLFLKLIKVIQSLPYNQIEGVYFSRSSLILLYICLFAIMFLISWKPQSYKDVFFQKRRRKKIAKLVISACACLLMINNLFYSYRTLSNEELVVYDIYKHTLMDVFSDGRLYSFSSESLPKKKKEFASASMRIFNGWTEENELNDQTTFSFKDKQLFIAHKPTYGSFIPCFSDVMLITNGTNVDPFLILDNHETRLIVMDSSLDYKTKKEWRQACVKRKIPFHDIKNDGAFRLS